MLDVRRMRDSCQVYAIAWATNDSLGGDFPEAAHDQADFRTKPTVRSQSLAMYNVVGIELILILH